MIEFLYWQSLNIRAENDSDLFAMCTNGTVSNKEFTLSASKAN